MHVQIVYCKNSQFQFHGDFKTAKERCLIIKIPGKHRKKAFVSIQNAIQLTVNASCFSGHICTRFTSHVQLTSALTRPFHTKTYVRREISVRFFHALCLFRQMHEKTADSLNENAKLLSRVHSYI